jgi:dTDP-4-amino-4,6-dideoxygalactose transaminase
MKLAIFGGKPVSTKPWDDYNTIGEEEKKAVYEVLDSGILSQFRAGAGPEFLGGPRVRALEEAWANYFDVKHAVSMNSLTSGLFACIGAAGIGPGDEVIVPPMTMSATATCVLIYGGIPVFADVDPDTFCMSPKSVESKITSRTRIIVMVHLFGYPADMDPVLELSRKHRIVVIEDCAQALAARHNGRYVGTFGHLAGFSLNYHKTIHCGEGGVIVTDDDNLAQRLRLIRNHGETATADMGVTQLVNTFGGNYRMTEIEAAIANEQLKKLETLTAARVELAEYLTKRIRNLPGLFPSPLPHSTSRHVYYRYAMRYDEKAWGIPRAVLVRAIRAEGIELREKYVRPIYLEPLYQQRVAFAKGFPFSSLYYSGEHAQYETGLCPVAEALYESELIFGNFCRWPLTTRHMDEVVQAFEKVYEQRAKLLGVGA